MSRWVKKYNTREEQFRAHSKFMRSRLADRQNHHMFGKLHSDETKQKIRMTLTGRAGTNKGRVFTDEWRRNISLGRKGKYGGEKNPNYGKKMPEWLKQKLVEISRNRVYTEEQRRERSSRVSGENHPLYNKTHSAVARAKIGMASAKRINDINSKMPNKDTKIERIIQQALTERGIKFETQKIFRLGTGYHNVDIFIEPNICIECDGYYWHSRPAAQIRDQIVTTTLQLMGYKVLRFWEKDINKKLEWCVDQILS